MEQLQDGDRQQFHHRRGHIGRLVRDAAIVIIIVAIIAYVALSWHGIPTITTNKTLTVLSGQSVYFKIKGNANTFALLLKNTSSAYGVVYISQVPVLTNPIVAFGLVNGQSVNVSTGGSTTADIEVKLVSASTKNATLKLLVIPSLFTIQTSPGVQVRYPASFYANSTSPPPIIITPPPTVVQNTTKPSSKPNTSTVTTPPPPTSTSTPLENISTILNTTYLATLMNNYKALYVEDRACTPSNYNTTFLAYRSQIPGAAGQQPIGPFDFANASQVTPTNVAVSVTQQGKGLYAVTYSVTTPLASFSGPVITFNITSTTGTITNPAFKGLFAGANYTDLENAYSFQNSIGGTCGAYIP